MYAITLAPNNSRSNESAINYNALFSEARTRLGMDHKTVAYLMGISPAQLSQQLASNGHISLQRLIRMSTDPDGRKFLQVLFALLGDSLGFAESDPILATLGQMLVLAGSVVGHAQLRMAGAPPRNERKRA